MAVEPNVGHADEARTNLSRSHDKQVGLRIPLAVDARLDRLVDAASIVGERTNRKEIVAALIADCPEDGEALSQRLRRYRKLYEDEV
jgi:hypothetical protein